jgi:hypothetical protein
LGATKNINRNLGQLTKGFSRLGKLAKATFAVFVANQAIGGLKGIISAGEQAIKTQNRLLAIFRNQGLTGTQAFRSINEEAKKLSLAIGVDDDVIADVQAKLGLFAKAFKDIGKDAKTFNQAVKLAFDFEAAGLGTALQGAEVLGKALADPLKAANILKKAGILLTQEQIKEIETLVKQGKIAEAQALILESVQGIIGGIAEKTALASDKIKVAIGQIFESLGILLLPVLDPVAKGFRAISESVVGTIEKSGGLNSIWQNYLVPIGKSVISTLDSFRKSLGFTDDVVKQVVGTIKILIDFFVGLFNTMFRNDQLNQTVIETFKKVYEAVGAFIQLLGEVFLPILNVLGRALLALYSVFLDALIKVLQIVIQYFLKVVGSIADFIKSLSNAVTAVGEFITSNKQILKALDFMKDGFGIAKDKVLEIGDAIGKGFIDKILDGIENTVGKLFGKLQELRDRVANFFTDLFNFGRDQQSKFEISVPSFGTPTPTPSINPFDSGQLVIPKPSSPSIPKQPSTIIKELPTGTPFGQAKPSVSNFNYSINVQALTPTPAVGKVVVDSIKQFEARSGTSLTRAR